MPVFEITSPDGKTFEITAPEGATKEQALEYAKSKFAPVQAARPQVPGNVVAPVPAPQISPMDRVSGVGEAALTALTAIPAGLAGGVAGIYQGLTGGKYGTPEGALEASRRAAEVSRNLTYSPRTEGGKAVLGDIASVIDKSKIAGLGPTEAMALSATAGPALSYAKNLAGNAIKSEMNLVAPKAIEAISNVVPLPKREVMVLARKAEALGINVRPDMLTDNKYMKIMGEALEKVPLSGSKADARQMAFNKALISQIGGDRNAARLTPDVFSRAMDVSGSTIGDIAKKTPIVLDKDTVTALVKQVSSTEFQTTDVGKIVSRYVQEITDKGKPAVVSSTGEIGTTVNGETFRRINSAIGRQVRSTSNGDLRSALLSLQDDLQEILARNITNPDDLAALQQARKQYAIGSTLIPLVAKSPAGDISPAALMSAATSSGMKKAMMARGGGDIGDLARIGQMFLKEPGSSNTAERGLVYAGLLGGSAAVAPEAIPITWGAANAYNRLGPSITKGILKLDPMRK